MITKKELEDGLFNLLHEHVEFEAIQDAYDAITDVIEVEE